MSDAFEASSVPAALPPYTVDRPRCSKCGHNGASTRHTATGSPCSQFSRVSSVGPTERLCRQCERCGYHWDEAIATNDDAAPFRGRLPLGQQFSVDLVFVGKLSPGETHVRVVHEPSGLHQALVCVNASSAKAAELPLLMFQALLDEVDEWGRQPIDAVPQQREAVR